MRLLLVSTTLLSLAAGIAFAAPAATATAAPVAAASADKSDYIPKEEWQKLSPEKKKAIRDERFKKRAAERAEWRKKFDAATPAEKEKMKAERRAEHEANKIKWKERYDAATPEEKKRMEERVAKRREKVADKIEAKKNQPATSQNAPPVTEQKTQTKKQ